MTTTGVPGVDLSDNNTVTSFHEIAGSGMQFVFIKSSEGASSKQSTYDGFASRADEVGLIRGAYHFFTSDDPVAQAQFFLTSANLATGNLIPVLDVEVDFSGVATAALACAMEIKQICGHFPILYTSDNFFQTNLLGVWPAEATLWIARYGADPVTSCSIWQNSESGTVPGVSGSCDLDTYLGTPDQLNGLVMP